MSADLGALFAAALDGGFGGELRKAAGPVALLDRPGLLGLDEDDDEAEITELDKFMPERIDGVANPASGFPVLLMKNLAAKHPEAARLRTRLLKAGSDEKRFTLVVAYPSMAADRSRAADGFRDFAQPDAIEAAAWDYIRKGGAVGLWHKDGTTGSGQAVESWIHRAAPWTLTAADGSTQTVNPGDWCVGIVWDEPAWALIKAGVITGVSMQGSALRRRPDPAVLANVRKSGGKKAAKKARRLAKASEQAQVLRKAQIAEQVRMAARAVVAEHFADLYARSSALRERIEFMEQQREQRARAAYGL